MNWIDLIAIILIVYHLAAGYSYGFAKSAGSLGALVGAFIFTPLFKELLVSLFGIMFQLRPALAIPLGMTATWLILYLAFSIGVYVIVQGIESGPLKLPNRLGGMLLGALVSWLILCLPLVAIESVPKLNHYPAIRQMLEKETLLWNPLLKPGSQALKASLGTLVGGLWLSKNDRQRIQR
ncbi:hypothetical protein COW36_01385 [bacterium (Candidatus Blackallbacteria) CG17_big_fil_post_rev_8_21_14_2_50_48_46]|uniref:CvpA family protein n=1 Tax=bacterium (Candidatus Blackallbacteria) CG17_big_fil_post_rev_8_21_14_2_50_48_46 TaxID=2014261 RepID=A0A2M7GBK7_9BACT|nr:MAG: hypothetical protein COW64_09790 [bacterium (Candidatus Blackallbacteria) CG18_big_fil_WC_8_21_14_2_50_49_26]PIW19520.1 MAG: hypothetical protein COW36_01385 [bacterium (Candidatus Blackallbacteria) CG17_big_fil_post_rev_8_21_14_2_50_48_46]PIW48876.1 MAG: hypothetical protein COW20_07070 [bacterium (Candidatus Blackallbacteria) CG13_big_fil_rev_8_21_14_2_50_49_14]